MRVPSGRAPFSSSFGAVVGRLGARSDVVVCAEPPPVPRTPPFPPPLTSARSTAENPESAAASSTPSSAIAPTARSSGDGGPAAACTAAPSRHIPAQYLWRHWRRRHHRGGFVSFIHVMHDAANEPWQQNIAPAERTRQHRQSVHPNHDQTHKHNPPACESPMVSRRRHHRGGVGSSGPPRGETTEGRSSSDPLLAPRAASSRFLWKVGCGERSATCDDRSR